MSCDLKPKSWEDFDKLHRDAWKNGWTYGPAFTELYLDYLENWNYFLSYIENLIARFHFEKKLTILIGEAPPFWAGNKIPDQRSYFYNPNHSNSSQPWLNEPYKYFYFLKHHKGHVTKIDGKLTLNKTLPKQEKLNFLADQGVVLLDIFPFPIFQDTDVRNSVSDGFSKHIKKYFVPHVIDVIRYIEAKFNFQIEKQYGLIAPEYTSLQLMYGINTSKIIWKALNPNPIDGIKVEKISATNFHSSLKTGHLPTEGEKAKFLYRIIRDNDWESGKEIIVENSRMELLPILVNGQSPTFNNFFNSKQSILKQKFGIKSK